MNERRLVTANCQEQAERSERRLFFCRFPPPWSAELQPNYYVVRDADGQQLAYVYYESEPGRRSAANVARSPFIGQLLLRPRAVVPIVSAQRQGQHKSNATSGAL